jgi:two-component system sensor histidine kinase YesM
LIINVNLGDLVTEMSKISNEYKGSYWIIYEKDQLLFSSPELDTEEVQKINDKIKSYAVVTLNGRKYFAIRGTMDINEWNYLHLISYDEVAKSQQMTAFLYVLMLSCGFLCSILMVHVIVRKITRHFDLLLYRMQRFGEDSTVLAEIPYDYNDRTDEIGILHRQFTHMAERIQTLVVENYRQQLLAKDAQLKSLESQMNPHFLYNTLDAINWRAKAIGEPEISQIADSLGHFLRMTLNKKERFTLKQELDIIHYYMTIQQLRFDNRLNFTESIPDACLDAQVPKLSIQPLLENAVHYALEQITDECIINLTCVYSQGLMQIYVKNSGSEFPDDLLENLRTHKIQEQGLGIALLNIEERIQLMFGQQYGLHFYNENDFAVVKMEIPYVKDDYRG